MRDGEISPEIQRLPSEGKEAAEGGRAFRCENSIKNAGNGVFGTFFV